jgi:hypothetical protein
MWVNLAPADPEPCIYCGVVADTIDHVPPQSARPRIIQMGMVSHYHFRTVPACRECNCALGTRSPWSLVDRKAWVKTWIKRRYARYLTIPDWEPEDLARLGPMLRKFTESGLAIRDVTRKRLAW